MDTAGLPKETAVYLDEIAERLWSGHASIMVGAGFSKNADKNSPKVKPFLNWAELSNLFYKKLNKELPSDGEHYLNSLKLADEVQAAFGRATLEKMIQTELPDLDYSPSTLHKALLELPWNDVFTTNYDTLLERTKVDVRYDIVVNKNDLVYSQRPRIVKLHGSFPSERPFIITEEDYRTYPRKYAPFVNTVQQSLIENTLCLIGFSGDDPNFLSWIGWIRDNLGSDNPPKLFLVGAFNFSSSQIKLLDKRNIAVVDLSSAVEPKSKYKDSLALFFQYLREKKKEEDRLDWPYDDSYRFPTSNVDDKTVLSEIINVTKQWQKTRSHYPGWIVCPDDNRIYLWGYTQEWLLGRHYAIKFPFRQDIDFWYELTWRLEKTLTPLCEPLSKTIEEVLSRYNPFPSKIKTPSEFSRNKSPSTDWDLLAKEWVYLQLALLRFFREEGLSTKWSETYEQLELIFEDLSPEQKEELQYQKCLYFLSQNKVEDCKENLSSWTPDDSLPFYQSKKAGLIAEQGEVPDAIELLEKALRQVRAQLNLIPVTTDYTRLSEEAQILQLLKFAKDALRDGGIAGGNRDYIEEYSQRWNKLKQYRCDPWGYLKVFNAKLDRPAKEIQLVENVNQFDIGKISTIRHLGRNDKEALEGYAFLRYVEETGVPFHILNTTFGKKAGIGAIKRIAKYNPGWATAVLLRMGDSKAASILFSRQVLQRMSSQEVERLTDHFLTLLNDLSNEIEKAEDWRNQNLGTHFARIIPEVLSRLITKCSINTKRRMLKFLVSVYSSNKKGTYSDTKNLVERLILSWPKCQYEELVTVLIAELKMPSSGHPRDLGDFPEPLHFLSPAGIISYCNLNSTISNAVKELIANFDKTPLDKRQPLFMRLAYIFDFQLMSEAQRKTFFTSLWNETDSEGFPKGLQEVFRPVLFRMALPENNTIKTALLKYVVSLKFPVIGKSKSFPYIGGQPKGCTEILRAVEFFEEINFTTKHAEDLYKKIKQWWDTDKHFLIEPSNDGGFGDRKEECRSRFYSAGVVLSEAVIPYISDEFLDQTSQEIESLIEEMRSLGVSVHRTIATYITRNPKTKEKYLPYLVYEVSSADWMNASRSAYALTMLSKHSLEDAVLFSTSEVLRPVVEIIKFRKMPALPSALGNFTYMFKEDPQKLLDLLPDIYFGLSFLADESSLLDAKSHISIEDRLSVRQHSAELASHLFHYFKKNGINQPDELIEWQKICASDVEFAEVRNEWVYLK